MSKLSDALEELQEAREELDETQMDIKYLFQAVHQEHEDQGHEGLVQWCPRPACAAVAELAERY